MTPKTEVEPDDLFARLDNVTKDLEEAVARLEVAVSRSEGDERDE